ncbi:Increased rDNA silencing protein 4 [Wickerhamomyces ciferrii]|uniref:Increased rDNA silencing protein 4 n=1 Tax=Wickerhamomyces ciferrii (strain ATCC 14091 / BCRC 22168 / CBS 111 / JCM 3599 / NBRC 0793 / NRRL Y-1031 F-60-10) TaxID=1206466 RepID=K0KFL4_WICCF|nr:Increased rDNA silencing protein 4 [Wickerhamomyces ciferrii]CCH43925.1 Increased rDNA silencing protein 4 [Wickerhamomyces ciferrii]
MGLLGRRHTNNQIPTIGKQDNQLNNAPSQSSLLAAQAAANLFQNSNSSQTTANNQHTPLQTPTYDKRPQPPHVQVRRSVSTSSASTVRTKQQSVSAGNSGNPPVILTKKEHAPSIRPQSISTTPTSHKPSVVVQHPAPKTPITPIVQHSAPQSRSRTPLPKIDSLNVRDNSSIDDKPRIRARSRSPLPPLRTGTDTSSPDNINNINTTQSIASIAARSAATSSAELLAPPPTAHVNNKVYPSSPSISQGSSNSIDSAPFSLKPPNFNPNFNKSMESTTNGDTIQVPHIQQSISPRFFFDSDQNYSDLEIEDKASSFRSNSAGSEFSSLAPKSARASGGSSSHLALDTIPSRIDEHEYEYESEPDEYNDDEVDYFNSRGINSGNTNNNYGVSSSKIEFSERVFDTPGSTSTRSSKVPIRKPPPSSSPPLQQTSMQHLNSYSGSITSGGYTPSLSRRNTSPKRKPPPGSSISQELDPIDPGDYNNQNSFVDEDEDALPQYPLSIEDQERRRRHRHHHGFRKNAKNIFKKGLKSATTSSSNPSNHLVNDEDSRPVHFKTTMRKEKKSTIFNEDKPWKHHNDREYITEQERKRYDGVWVANKGLYMDLVDPATLVQVEDIPERHHSALKASKLSTNSELTPSQETNLMLNLVARDLWSRSQLSPIILRQIWDLVDTRKDGTIERKSFIIGMWLVDQCLYGRKLPKVLDESVWNSVSQLGVNVVIKPKKR